jgi:hypothetical protein
MLSTDMTPQRELSEVTIVASSMHFFFLLVRLFASSQYFQRPVTCIVFCVLCFFHSLIALLPISILDSLQLCRVLSLDTVECSTVLLSIKVSECVSE